MLPALGERMDASQRAVLQLPEGTHAAVLGAPGTGKTSTLVELVAARVREPGWGSDAVLALAPTRQSATRLRDILARRIDVPTTGPLARTVASLAFEIVRESARAAGAPPPRLVSGTEQDELLAALLSGHIADATGPVWPEILPEQVRSLRRFRTELRELMMRATEYGVDTVELRQLGRVHRHPEWEAAADVIEEYQQVIGFEHENRLDPAELAAFAVEAVRRGEAGPRVAALRLVVVDDLQEATESTLALLRALADRGVAIVAFGDPDVAANAFRGGEPDALGRLATVLGHPARTLVLATSHRQGPALRELVGRVVSRVGAAAAGAQRAATAGAPDDPHALVRLIAPSPARQWAAAARALREEHLVNGVPYSSMAVIVRSGSQLAAIERAFALGEVPTRTTVAGRAVRDDPAARALLTVVRVGIGHADLTPEIATELLIGPFGGLDRLALRRLRLALRAEEVAGGGRRSADDLLVDALGHPARLSTIDHRVARRAERLAGTLELVRTSGGTIEDLLWLAWERSGLARVWRDHATGGGITAAEAGRDLDGIVALFTAATRFTELRPGDSPQTFLDEVLGAEVPEDTLSPRASGDAVLITTPSATVGLEFEVVVVGGLQEGAWPNLRLRGSLLAPQDLVHIVTGVEATAIDARRQVLGDELRMFALAVSRARRRVILAAVATDDESPSVLLGFLPDSTPVLDPGAPPLTLRAQVGRLRARLVRAQGRGADAAATLAALAVEGVAGADPDEWNGLLPPSSTAPLFEDEPVPVSPSAIERLVESPLDWFLDYIAGSESGVVAAVGTILHWAMETADDISVDALWAAVESRWGELIFEAPWLAERQRDIARGFVAALAEYLADAERDGTALVGAESRFRLEVGRAVLSGSIDRVERTADGRVVIVDLKTGTPETSAARLAEHPQLSAYQLAYASGMLDDALEPHGPHRGGGAKLLFVKEGVRGKLYREGVQALLDEEGLAAFRARVEAAAALIAAAEFTGPAELPLFGRGDTSGLRLHRVREVSSD
jgi:superfamily I DNA/RNA helicase/RecB family exonuclease